MKAFFYTFLIIIFLTGLSSARLSVEAETGADLYFKNIPDLAETTDEIIVAARVNPHDLEFNAVSLQVEFDANILNVKSIETGYSFCVYFFENAFNNASGTLAIQCGLPTPATSTDSLIAEIHFIKISEGLSNVNIKETSEILANDGLGTNIIKDRFGIVL